MSHYLIKCGLATRCPNSYCDRPIQIYSRIFKYVGVSREKGIYFDHYGSQIAGISFYSFLSLSDCLRKSSLNFWQGFLHFLGVPGMIRTA